MNTLQFAVVLFFSASLAALSGCKKENDSRDNTTGGDASEKYIVTTLAGNGTTGYVDGPGSSAQFGTIVDITVDGQGNVYVADRDNYAIRKITPAGVVSTIAGGGGRGYLDGQGSAAMFQFPTIIAVDGQGNVYVVDRYRIRKISPAGMTTTLAGGEMRGSIDGEGTAARFNEIHGMTIEGQGNIYVNDIGIIHNEESKIRKITPSGSVTTFSRDQTLSSHIWIENDGSVYSLNNFLNNEIVKFSSTGTRTVVRSFPDYTIGIVSDKQGNFYFTKGGNFSFSNEGKVFMFDASGKITSIAGTGKPDFADGKGNVAMFNYPADLAMDTQGNIYVNDAINKRIRKISK